MELLTINKKDANADDNQGPSVESEDMNERIEARRTRIKKKNEMNQKKKLGIKSAIETEKKKELSKSRKQIQDSRARLVKLEKDGQELVTNIRVAADTREHIRRSEEEEDARQRKERLEQEAKTANEKFDEIVKKWETAHSKDIPQELHEMLMDQKQLCDSMIDDKNKLINDFKQKITEKSDFYVKALKKYSEDIDLMIERMKDQTTNMKRFYLDEIITIEDAFIGERKELLDKHRKEFDEKMEERRTKEVAFLEERFKRVERNENELHSLRVKDAEEYNEMKVKLETDVQILEQQLQQMKATYQLNQEKLAYNYQVLQKRDEENAKTKAQQKRKITKLQDSLTNLKKKLAKQMKQFNEENQTLSDDYKRVTDMFNDLELKSKHFLSVDLKKFNDIWKMNEEQAKEIAANLLCADRIIFEQQLGLEWKSPDTSFMNNVGPIDDAQQVRTGKEFINELFDEEDEENLMTNRKIENNIEQSMSTNKHEESSNLMTDRNENLEGASPTEANPTDEPNLKFPEDTNQFRVENHDIILNLSKYTLRRIVMLICDEAGFLLEQKLVHLLQPLEKNEKSMVKLDSIFKALGVETEVDVKLLAQYFINHRKYQELVQNKSYVQKRAGGDNESSVSDEAIEKIVPLDAVELIHPNEVLTALKTFATLNQKSDSKKKLAKFSLSSLNDRNDSADSEYWMKYENLIDDKKNKLWDAMLSSLQKYQGVLIRRSQLIDENKALANQNIELRMLLAQYMQSTVNQELEIPPTKILQMEYSK